MVARPSATLLGGGEHNLEGLTMGVDCLPHPLEENPTLHKLVVQRNHTIVKMKMRICCCRTE